MRHVLDSLISALKNGETPVLATIVKNAGSSPRTSGARMLVLQDTSVGSVGGGMVEGACQKEAVKLLNDSRDYVLKNFDLIPGLAADEGMICGGAVSVLLQKVEPDRLALFEAVREQYKGGERPVFLTRLPREDEPPELLLLDDELLATFSPSLQKQLAKCQRESFTVSDGQCSFFVEPLVHPGTLHLVGGGHVSLALAHLASFVGFEVVVMDDRKDFANEERFPMADTIKLLPDFQNCFTTILGRDDYVVIVTRGHAHDRDVLEQVLKTNAGYIGMIGSLKKRDSIYKQLRAKGFTEEQLERVHCPIGLAIGADTPAEIGVSIVGELVQARADI